MPEQTSYLITADQLKQALADDNHATPVILDCRFNLADPDQGRRQYDEGHIPGAYYADLDQDLSGPVVSGRTGRHPLPDPVELQTTLRQWGIHSDSEVVVYDGASAMMAARAWWLCLWAGLSRVRVLDGGWQAWQSTDGPVESTPNTGKHDGTIDVQCSRDWIIDALELSGTADQYTLLDARALPRYTGDTEPMDHKAGHIPGAICADFAGNLDASGQFKSPEALRQRFESLPDDASLVCYCGSGVTACHTILALMLANHPRPRLYAGSWSEWINDDSRPIATGTDKEPL